MKKIIVVLTLFFAQLMSAQVGNGLPGIENLILAADDASLLLENYTKPIFKGFINNLNGGWYSSAKVHNKFGFDINFNANYAFVPESDLSFIVDPANKEYQYLTTSDGNPQVLQTIASKDTNSTPLTVQIPVAGGNQKVAQIPMPGGIVPEEVPYVGIPSPMLQLGFGLPFRTDIKLRYAPEYKYQDVFKANLLGLGFQHDLLQYFRPKGRKVFNLSGLFAFTNINIEYFINDDLDSENVTVNNGVIGFSTNAWTAQLIGSMDFWLISIYGSYGYNSGWSKIFVDGDFNLKYDIEDSSGNVLQTVSETISNPISIDNQSNGDRFTLGARLNLAFFRINVDYTLQEYNMITAGAAFTFDWPKFSGSNNKRKNSNSASSQTSSSSSTLQNKSEEDINVEPEQELDNNSTIDEPEETPAPSLEEENNSTPSINNDESPEEEEVTPQIPHKK